MSKFKVGDKARIRPHRAASVWTVKTVNNVYGVEGSIVQFEGDLTIWYREDDLDLVAPSKPVFRIDPYALSALDADAMCLVGIGVTAGNRPAREAALRAAATLLGYVEAK